MKTVYSHAFTIAFAIETTNGGADVTEAELVAGLRKRIADLENARYDGIVEACGLPFDTYEIESD